ncbi:hypothetical protein GCM10017783_13140 [Deinococcus piscis]|uniref:Uncharacterized protein n=1 Tax=Deinococcus piscis TaxID=394230 RepID=A0ABQ3K5V2_9DEIO|nr:AAA family ATPase [Deinococcus piscis]GHG02229.1 hypothetical protein GCM10017783_13140 [Deinococcus piscis]
MSDFFTDLWTQAVQTVQSTLQTNELAQGGLVIAALSALAVWARTLPLRTWNYAVSRLSVTLEVQDSDPAFPWLAAWLAAQPGGQNLRQLGVSTRYGDRLGGQTIKVGTDHDGDDVTTQLIPLGGQTLLRYRSHWLLAQAGRMERKAAGGYGNVSPFHQTITLRLPVTARSALPELLAEAFELTAGASTGQLEIHVPQYDGWKLAERRPARPLASLVYDGELLSDLQADLTQFFASRDWYTDMGIPYRRGYLLHGPPGNGKSSLVAALAGAHGMNVCVLNLATPGLDDDRLNSLLSDLPRRALLLLEDIDAVFLGREARNANVKLSFNGLLNALDGVAAGEGRVTFMTTNDLAGLDSALIRPGRADRQLRLSNATHAQVAGMLRRFWPNWEEPRIARLSERVPDGQHSMARVQEYLLQRRDDEAAVERDWYELSELCPTRHLLRVS